ncbi:hypothetical protein [Tessaracoccus antarcticus]|nr:hypothetical protein [Tessaracoccus antarcticus]
MAEDLPGVTDITDSDEPGRPGGVRWFGVVLLLAYVALMALGAWSLWLIAGEELVAGISAGVFVFLYALGWRLWLAPGSDRRLAFKERLTVHLIAGPVVVVLGSLAGVWLPMIVALSAVIMCDALNERDRHPAVGGSAPDLI